MRERTVEPASFATRWRTLKATVAKFFARNTRASILNTPSSRLDVTLPAQQWAKSHQRINSTKPCGPFDGSGRFSEGGQDGLEPQEQRTSATGAPGLGEGGQGVRDGVSRRVPSDRGPARPGTPEDAGGQGQEQDPEIPALDRRS